MRGYLLGSAAFALVLWGCTSATQEDSSAGSGNAGTGSAGTLAGMSAGSAGTAATGAAGSAGTSAGNAPLAGASGTSGSGGASGSAGAAGAAGDAQAGSSAGTGGTAGNAGTGASGTGSDEEPEPYDLDCGPDAIVLESHGPPTNRINYIIVGDGYTESDLETTYVEHLEEMLRVRFEPELEPYLTYRRFVNICALKVPSEQSGVGTSPGNTAFRGYGNDQSRLGYIEDDLVYDAFEEYLPAEIEVDWGAVVLNGDRWWNAGGRLMVWSGAHPDAALAAMHEGGHSFQRLADEYGGNCTFSGNESQMRVNVTMDAENTAGKWTEWLGFDQSPGTGMQGTFEGAQYCDRGAWRPSEESVMNMLWDSSSFNSISLEQAVRILYEKVDPIDSSTPASETSVQVLEVQVIDPAVISLEWSVDGEVVAGATSGSFDVAAQSLASGQHTIVARAYDDTEWVRGDREELEQTVEWTINVP